ncbi:MAG: esterase [Eubacterium sp.]|nr:esterase [Eubacterium sp.]
MTVHQYPNERAEYLLLQCVDEHDAALLDSEYRILSSLTDIPFSLVAVQVESWNSDLSPWEAPPVFGKEPFGGNARATLDGLTETLLPSLEAAGGWRQELPIILGGYSLAGLFALWCGYHSTRFSGIAAASPSVWFNGWIEHAASHPFLAQAAALSLGDQEAKTRNAQMATVADCLAQQQTLLTQQGVPCSFEWHPGNHFRDSDRRTAKAFASVIALLESITHK